MKKKALITGITGQDGSYLCDFLMRKGYQIIGVKRRSSSFNTKRIDHIYNDIKQSKNFIPYYGDLTDSSNILRIIQSTKPDEIYNLAAQSHVHTSFEIPEYSANADALGTLRMLEAIRVLKLQKKTKFYQASTSEIFGNTEIPQNEKTPFRPRSPYAISKLYAYWTTVNYREAYNIFAVNGILFNHEGPRRGETFVTRKITRAVTRIHLGIQKKLTLGNLDASRDWGYAKDYMEAVYMILQHKEPDDWVIATGETYTVREFLETSFSYFNLDWEDYVLQDSRYFRPNEVEYLHGDISKASKELKWKPKTSFNKLVEIMLEEDLKLAEKEKVLINNNMLKPTWEYPAE